MLSLNTYILEKLRINKDTENLLLNDDLEKWIKPIKNFVKDNITLNEKYYNISCVRENFPNGPLDKIQFSTGVITTHSKELEELPEKIRKFLDDNNIKNKITGDMIDNPIGLFLINIKLYK